MDLSQNYFTLSELVAKKSGNATLIAVCKGQPLSKITALQGYGQRHFGENRVQEAEMHWQALSNERRDTTLHYIGALQSNKLKAIAALFDVVHTLDRPSHAQALNKEVSSLGKRMDCLVQVNLGEEPQKEGVSPNELAALIHATQAMPSLNLIGLMCVPPRGEPPAPYFALLQKLASRYDLPQLSMGMSEDFETALRFGATYIRIGTALFGERDA